MTIIPLHIHTYFSTRGGAHSPEEWCEYAASLGYTALGVADRAPLAAYPAFAHAAKVAGIKPLFGIELDLLLPLSPPEDAKPKRGSKAASSTLGPQPSTITQPILLFARDQDGLGNLAKLGAMAYAGWPRDERAVEWEALLAHTEGLLAILLPLGRDGAAPLGSAQPKHLSELGAHLHEALGGMAFMGLPAPLPGDDTPTRQAQATANYLGLPAIALPTARYLRPGDAPAYAANAVGSGQWAVGKIRGGEHLLAPEEAAAIFEAWPEAVELGTHLIEMCLNAECGMRNAELVEAQDGEVSALLPEAEKGLLARLGVSKLPEEARERLGGELKAVSQSGGEASWLALAGLVNAARKSHILLGAPLGGAAASLLAYALGVSPVDPTQEPAPAWLQGEVAPPVGIEIPASRRDELLKALVGELGQGSFAQAACITDITPLHALRAATHVLQPPDGLPATLAAKALESGWDALSSADNKDEGALSRLALSLRGAPLDAKPDPDTLLIIPTGGLGLLHPPMLKSSASLQPWTPWTERDLRAQGYPTLTLHPTHALDVVEGALEMRNGVWGAQNAGADPTLIPAPSRDALDLLKAGATVGIPYLTPVAAKTLADGLSAEPEHDNLSAKGLTALIAAIETANGPAPKATHHAWGRIALRAANLKATHPAALLAAALHTAWQGGGRDTPAAIAAEARRLGISLLPPDASLSDPLPIPSGLPAAGSQQQAEQPTQNSAFRWGLAHLPGWGLGAAQRFVAARPPEGIATLRELAETAHRAGLSQQQCETLIHAGACDMLGGQRRDRTQMLALLASMLEWASSNDNMEVQPDLFSAATGNEPPNEESTWTDAPPSPRERYRRCEWERESLGVGLTEAGELDALHAAVERSGGLRARLLATSQVGREKLGESALMVGMLSSIRLVQPTGGDRGGAPLATALLEDSQGSIELVAFPPNYQRHSALWTEGNPLIVTARVGAHDDGELYLLCEHLAPLESGETEAELQITVKSKGSAGPKPPKDPLPDTQVLAKPSDQWSVVSGQRAAGSRQPAVGRSGDSEHSVLSPQSSVLASATRYRLVISLPQLDDDHEAIDTMIALNAALSEHPGEDIVTLRIPYVGGKPHIATAQLPRGARFTPSLRDHVERLFGVHALAVIEL